mmetsp:Transcript_1998/g.7333  ORF Transcript_1998/g.7333 Transcript_1998/m.7333 type:complete len:412 (-) Transcript_1998:192-1427(-)
MSASDFARDSLAATLLIFIAGRRGFVAFVPSHCFSLGVPIGWIIDPLAEHAEHRGPRLPSARARRVLAAQRHLRLRPLRARDERRRRPAPRVWFGERDGEPALAAIAVGAARRGPERPPRAEGERDEGQSRHGRGRERLRLRELAGFGAEAEHVHDARLALEDARCQAPARRHRERHHAGRLEDRRPFLLVVVRPPRRRRARASSSDGEARELLARGGAPQPHRSVAARGEDGDAALELGRGHRRHRRHKHVVAEAKARNLVRAAREEARVAREPAHPHLFVAVASHHQSPVRGRRHRRHNAAAVPEEQRRRRLRCLLLRRRGSDRNVPETVREAHVRPVRGEHNRSHLFRVSQCSYATPRGHVPELDELVVAARRHQPTRAVEGDAPHRRRVRQCRLLRQRETHSARSNL